MKWWPFAKEKAEPIEPASEPSTMDRMLSRVCTRDEFFLLYSKLLQERLPDCKVEFSDGSTLHVVRPDGKESTTYLTNFWLKYKEGNEDRQELIEKYARLAEELGKLRALPERQNVVAMIKDSQYMEIGKVESRSLADHLCGDLWVVYAEDQPDRISTLQAETIVHLGVPRSELRALAVENLKRILPAAECHGDGPWYLLTAGADYVASLLLFDSLWDELKEMVEGDVVATAPTRDVVMFTGSHSREGLAEIRKRSSEICNTGAHAISETLIIRKNGNWSVFDAN
jgi:uncharacterized protein YtpQ (UPF0354 family)